MSKEYPKVSLVVPVYNAEDYVAEAIESILAQTYKDIELIVVDDGSSDGSLEIISAYADRCTVISQENRGQSAALNAGWEISTGDKLGYLSADDKLESSAVEYLVSAWETQPEAVMVYPDYWLIDESSSIIRRIEAPTFDYADVALRGSCPVGPGALFKRELLEFTGGWDAMLRQIPDYDFLLRVGLFGDVLHVRKALAGFRVHGASQTFAASDESKAREYHYVLDKFFSREDVPAAFRDARPTAEANSLVLMARLHFRAGRFLKAFDCLRQAYSLVGGAIISYRNFRLLINGIFGRVFHGFRVVCSKWI
ncbi:glycosyl transferase family 2 [Pseudomonas sp. SJZ079]|uniref:glycosyltransferase n=1 Tax=Pseudomonas sp. SJZ079 TaxID=2572887 RepID=UPI0011996108|nr:glycosyltransferase [Pseudomonas sp. SJZ079]TWC34979.1 glycosyl transferase family 2 [Pseudomonas sp. SJZ079]